MANGLTSEEEIGEKSENLEKKVSWESFRNKYLYAA